jgi:MoaA/NifB/PqqE/SkfB family radical SAM enzyme
MTSPSTPDFSDPVWIPAPSGPLPVSLGAQRLTMDPPPRYPSAMVNVTNRCNLECKHCFVFREGNPNQRVGEMKQARVLSELKRLKEQHGLSFMLWMGGEPMLRWRTLEKGVRLFQRNTITTNGTVPLKDFGLSVLYVISLDGPRDVNDEVRGEGVFDRVMKNVAAIPDGFQSRVTVQSVVHRQNQDRLEELVRELVPTRVQGMTFSFYVPSLGEVSPRAWESNEERELAVDIVVDLKRRYPELIRSSSRSLELLRPRTAKLVTDNCPLLKVLLPLYIEGDHFTTPFCCHGNDVDCDRCGSWGVFAIAARMPGPWDSVEP